MPLYVSLGRLTAEGAKDLKSSTKRFSENKKAFDEVGARLISSYVLLGRYDFLSIFEAPDGRTAMKLAAKTSSRGTSLYETLEAFPIDEFFKIAEEL